MAEQAQLSEAFEAHRPHLLRVAYGTLGSVADAEDVVQEAWLRLQRMPESEVGRIRDLRAWLTRVVGRLALDALRRAHRTREVYVGQWLPEPIVEPLQSDPADPADRVTLADSVTMALMVVLERLSPAERAAFVLSEVFGMPAPEVAEVVGRTPEAVRQLVTRARRHVDEARPRFPATPDDQQRVVSAFARACTAGDLEALLATLDERVVWRSDGGGRTSALRRPLHDRARVAKALLGFARRPPREGELALVNGLPGLVIRDHDGVLTVMSFTVDAGRIVAIESHRNPQKLTHVNLP